MRIGWIGCRSGQNRRPCSREEGFAGRLGERVGRTVAEVQAGLVAALAEAEKASRASTSSMVTGSTTPARRKCLGLAARRPSRGGSTAIESSMYGGSAALRPTE
jgi:hypothetical protein